MIELRHLRYFIAVAKELHFGHAAEKLHMAQPPLSQQIRQLEDELGFQLFHRTKRSVKLTEAGVVFLAESRQLLQQLEQAVQTGRKASRGDLGELVLGFVSSAAYSVLPMILRGFSAAVPDVRLELHELTTDQQIQWLHESRLDIGLVRLPVDDDAFYLHPIHSEPLVVALPECHPLAAQSQVSLQRLSTERFILFPRPFATGLYDQIISLCQQAGFSPKIVQEAIQMQTIVSLVAADIGIAIVPSSLQNLQRTGVVYREFVESTPTVAIALLCCKADTSPTVQRFVDIVQQIVS